MLLELNISSYSEHFNRCKFNPFSVLTSGVFMSGVARILFEH